MMAAIPAVEAVMQARQSFRVAVSLTERVIGRRAGLLSVEAGPRASSAESARRRSAGVIFFLPLVLSLLPVKEESAKWHCSQRPAMRLHRILAEEWQCRRVVGFFIFIEAPVLF